MARPSSLLLSILALAVVSGAAPAARDDGQRLLTLDHYVRHTSNVPALQGQLARYEPAVREAVWAEMLASDPVGASWGFDELGATDKVLVDLACSSHNAMWEKNHLLMFSASLDWLRKGAVGDQKNGVIRLGY